MSTSSTSSGGGLPWWNWLLLVIGGLITFSLVMGMVVLFFGRVAGQEFSPDTFARRTFLYFRVPIIDYQVSDLVFVTSTPATETKVIPLIPPAAGTARWHYVANVWDGREAWQHPAAILVNYLDSGNGTKWGDWTTTHPAMAKVFWPIVADLARHEEYPLLPDLFDLAANSPDDNTFQPALEAKAAELLREEGGRRQAIGQSSTAIDAFTRSLTLRPKSPATLRARAAAYRALGDAERAKADEAKADELKGEAIRLPLKLESD